MLGNKVDILVVEDDPDMQETINNILAREGFILRFSDSGADMREQIRAQRPTIDRKSVV